MNRLKSIQLAGLGLLGLLALPAARAEDPLAVADRMVQAHLRYVYGSEDPESGGIDCSGFTRLVFLQAAGIDLPDQADRQLQFCREHGRVWDATSHWTAADLQPGDLVFFAGPKAIPRLSNISHVMIYCGHGSIVGSQGKGHRIDGEIGGAGYYHFHVRPPQGLPGEPGDRFVGHRRVFAYARLNLAELAHPVMASTAFPLIPLPGQSRSAMELPPNLIFGVRGAALDHRFD